MRKQRARRMMDGAQGEQPPRPQRERGSLKLDEVLEGRRAGYEPLGEEGEFVPMVVEDAERGGGADRVPVEVREHLLAALKLRIQEEDHGDRLVRQLGAVPEGHLDGGPPVLPIVDDELGIHGDAQDADPSVGRVADGFEGDLRVDRRGDRREHVAIRVADHVARDLRDPHPVELPLGAKLGNQLLLVEQKYLGNQAHWAHRDVVPPLRLDALDGREHVLESYRHELVLPPLEQYPWSRSPDHYLGSGCLSSKKQTLDI